MKNTMFVDYEWKSRDGGLYGEFHAEKIFSVGYDDKEDLVNSVLRLMKTKEHCTVTFQCFTGYETIDLLRLVSEDAYGLMSRIYWERDVLTVNRLPNTVISRNDSINKREIRESVDMALKLFEKQE